jgi:hypothetical protein
MDKRGKIFTVNDTKGVTTIDVVVEEWENGPGTPRDHGRGFVKEYKDTFSPEFWRGVVDALFSMDVLEDNVGD